MVTIVPVVPVDGEKDLIDGGGQVGVGASVIFKLFIVFSVVDNGIEPSNNSLFFELFNQTLLAEFNADLKLDIAVA